MSSVADKNTSHHEEHGTTGSYVIGFVLSLIFTIIPYYLVVEKVVSGMTLLATILGFAIVQMIIQIVFFLHLGREKKPHWQLLFFISTVGIILVVVGGSIWIIHHLHYNMTPVTPDGASKKLIEDEGIYQIQGQKTGACQGQYTTYKITIKDGVPSPSHIDAHKCDKLTFINEDDKTHYIMFGTLEHPEAYAGEDMLTVTKRRAKMIVLSETGTHRFHDHLNSKTAGDFTVRP
jgi:cytochrome o ubiquinol oxidase operon protein cyoD